MSAGVPAHPAYGYHVARFARVASRGLISGPELTVVLETAVAYTDDAVVWDETSVAAPGTGRDRYGLLLNPGDPVHVEYEGFGKFVGPDGGNGLNVQIGDDEIVSCAIQQVRLIGPDPEPIAPKAEMAAACAHDARGGPRSNPA
jgi:hypothetical protein